MNSEKLAKLLSRFASERLLESLGSFGLIAPCDIRRFTLLLRRTAAGSG